MATRDATGTAAKPLLSELLSMMRLRFVTSKTWKNGTPLLL